MIHIFKKSLFSYANCKTLLSYLLHQQPYLSLLHKDVIFNNKELSSFNTCQQIHYYSKFNLTNKLPSPFIPYVKLMRWDKFSATWLLAWPCFWSISLASNPGSFPDLKYITLYGIGAILLRGAGCTINDIWDKDLDNKVERTSSRPLANNTLSYNQALGVLSLQLTFGLIILLQLNNYSKILGASSLLLVSTYPLMKRFTYLPQAYLGATINWGALLGYSGVKGYCDWPIVLPLYISGIFWTLIYDTIYACQDKNDDLKVGIKSTAILFDKNLKLWLSGFGSLQILNLMTVGYMANLGNIYYLSVFCTSLHLLWQISSVNILNRSDCMNKFASNKWLGAILCSGIVLDKYLTPS